MTLSESLGRWQVDTTYDAPLLNGDGPANWRTFHGFEPTATHGSCASPASGHVNLSS